jgi:hypothetical protein
MTKQNILVVVAHPDDETLWFYGGLKRLSQKFNVDILCLTLGGNSVRAREVVMATTHLAVNVIFGDLAVHKRSSLLCDLQVPVMEHILKKPYKLIITHPPGGNLNSHPHYLQCFHVIRRIANRHKIRFGFFSESPQMSQLQGKYRFRFTSWDYAGQFFNYYLMHVSNGSIIENRKELLRELCFSARELFNRSQFYLFSFYPNMFRKKRSLTLFSPEQKGPMQKRNLLDSTEYLYLQKR